MNPEGTNMKISHIALACAVAFTGTAALAQNETANAKNAQPQQSASEFGNKVKGGAKRAANSTKNAFNKLRGKPSSDTTTTSTKSSRDTAASSGTASSSSMSSASSDTSGTRQKRMDDAYSEYQSKNKK